MKFLRLFLLPALPFFVISCGPPRKIPNYLQNQTDTSGNGAIIVPELKIQKNDLLSIQVFSLSTDPKADAPYNLPEGSEGSKGFLVDAKGNIEYPRFGTIHVEGWTKAELAAELKKRLTEPVEVLKSPTVIIRFLNFRVTILGPVAREGVLNMPVERLTILEAVGLAGGVTDFGKKTNIKVIREVDGKRETGYVDLTSKDLFDSPYYNLVQNDMIIVEPTKQRARMTDQAFVTQRITLALGLITSAAFLYNIFK
jgi:polysaccharide export outer membrane protein